MDMKDTINRQLDDDVDDQIVALIVNGEMPGFGTFQDGEDGQSMLTIHFVR